MDCQVCGPRSVSLKISNAHQRVLLAFGNLFLFAPSWANRLHIFIFFFQSTQGFRCPNCLGDDSGAGGITGQNPGSNIGWFLEPKGSCKASLAHHPLSVWNLFQKPTLWWLGWDLFLAGWPEISGGWICYQGVLGSPGAQLAFGPAKVQKKKKKNWQNPIINWCEYKHQSSSVYPRAFHSPEFYLIILPYYSPD